MVLLSPINCNQLTRSLPGILWFVRCFQHVKMGLRPLKFALVHSLYRTISNIVFIVLLLRFPFDEIIYLFWFQSEPIPTMKMLWMQSTSGGKHSRPLSMIQSNKYFSLRNGKRKWERNYRNMCKWFISSIFRNSFRIDVELSGWPIHSDFDKPNRLKYRDNVIIFMTSVN